MTSTDQYRSNVDELQNSLKCLYMNARSLRRTIQELFAVVEAFRPDVIGITDAYIMTYRTLVAGSICPKQRKTWYTKFSVRPIMCRVRRIKPC